MVVVGNMNEAEQRRVEVRKAYARVAKSEGACCDASYSARELAEVPPGAFLGQGSGTPVRHAEPREGEVVVDLGSGAGVDVFLTAKLVGPEGRSIGVDMTPEMVGRARDLAERDGYSNVEFHEALIEALPLQDESADVVLSNCVINLSPDKATVFREAFRVLRPGGRLIISDIVQEHPLNMKTDCGCVSTAMVRADYLETIEAAGFSGLELLEDKPAVVRGGSVDASAITLRAFKPGRE